MKLHIGCGNVILPGWVNLDIVAAPGVDIVDDASALNRIEDESVDIIYASHILDHFSRHDTVAILATWRRKLRPGGTLRVAVSDFDAVVVEYICSRELTHLLGHIVGGHKSAYDKHGVVFDETSLSECLLSAGFVDVRRWDWRQTEHRDYDDFSQAYWPHMNKTSGRHMSLNLEATKPQCTG